MAARSLSSARPSARWAGPVNFVDPDEPENFRAALNDKTKAIWVESLANPGGVLVDLEAIAAIANEAHVPLIVDNTLASPYLCRPFDHGADLVMHSATKFLGGHGNSMGGVVVESGRFDWAKVPGKYPSLAERNPAYHDLSFYETFGNFGFPPLPAPSGCAISARRYRRSTPI